MNKLDIDDIIYGQHCVPQWSWHVLPGQHAGVTFWSAWGGSGVMRMGSNEYRISAGDFFLIDYRNEVFGIQDQTSPLRVRYVDFIPLNPEIMDEWPEHQHLESPRFIGELLDRLQTAYRKGSQSQQELWLNAVLLEYYHSAPPRDHHPYSAKIDLLCQQFQCHPERTYDIHEIAREHSYEVDHFIRIFKHAKGTTPYAYLQNIRFETAKILLRNSDNSIGQIADAVGFADIYAFSRFFRQKAGCAPSTFRNCR